MNLFYFNSRFIFLIYSLILIEKTDITKTSIIGRAHLQIQTIFGHGIGKVFSNLNTKYKWDLFYQNFFWINNRETFEKERHFTWLWDYRY